MSANWLAVASADHIARGRAGGFMQVNHGKLAPLKRVQAGDRIVYYSPTREFKGKTKLQAFTAIGIVKEGEPYIGDMGGDFKPYRRDVEWLDAKEAPIAPLLDRLEFSAGNRNWGYKLRLGMFAISDDDLRLIAAAMGARV